jgi:hypothetical protein
MNRQDFGLRKLSELAAPAYSHEAVVADDGRIETWRIDLALRQFSIICFLETHRGLWKQKTAPKGRS